MRLEPASVRPILPEQRCGVCGIEYGTLRGGGGGCSLTQHVQMSVNKLKWIYLMKGGYNPLWFLDKLNFV